ncbi:Twitchin [Dirofilaria immitis]|nr:Twitchin [Dirofilaria immitis]
MPGAPRFTQKPSIQQTSQGDLLMECYLEADPPPDIVWNHAGMPIVAGPRVELILTNLQSNLYKAILIIKEPNVGDGGAYKCTASNQFGESNANINLNFAGAGDEQKGMAKGPTFLSKPRIIPKDGGALIVMECRVKSISKPHGVWYKNGAPIHENALYSIFFSDLGESSYLLQLELHNPVAEDAGQYRCNIKNDLGETNANLTLNFEQEPVEKHEKIEKPSKRFCFSSVCISAKLKARTATPTQEIETNASTTTEVSETKTEQMEIDNINAKRKSLMTLPAKEKKSRQKSPRPKSKSPRPDILQTTDEKAAQEGTGSEISSAIWKITKDTSVKVDKASAESISDSELKKSIGSIDETSESGLRIGSKQQRERMGIHLDGGASEDEISESISELPSVSEIAYKKPQSEQSSRRISGSSTKPSRRRSSVDMRRENLAAEILAKPSTPLRNTGPEGPPRILEIPENVTVTKNDTAVLKCKVAGNPAPTYKWSKGLCEIPSGGRCRIVTDQQDNSVNLVMQKCRTSDDGPYTLTIENKHGRDSAAVKLLVISETGLDFRSMLKHREHEEGGDEDDEKALLRGQDR